MVIISTIVEIDAKQLRGMPTSNSNNKNNNKNHHLLHQYYKSKQQQQQHRRPSSIALLDVNQLSNIHHRTHGDPRETSWLNPPWQATDNSNPSQMGLSKTMAKSELIKPQFHIGEFPNGHIVWPAIKYDPKKADMEVPAENPPKFGPDFGQERNGVDDKKDIIPPPEYPPDEFQIKEPANAPPDWHKEVGEVYPGISKKPCITEEMDLKNIAKIGKQFMSPHPIAPKGTTSPYEVNDGSCDNNA